MFSLQSAQDRPELKMFADRLVYSIEHGHQRRKQSVSEFMESILICAWSAGSVTIPRDRSRVDLDLSCQDTGLPANIVAGTSSSFFTWRRCHPVTNETAWLVGRIEGQEAAKG